MTKNQLSRLKIIYILSGHLGCYICLLIGLVIPLQICLGNFRSCWFSWFSAIKRCQAHLNIAAHLVCRSLKQMPRQRILLSPSTSLHVRTLFLWTWFMQTVLTWHIAIPLDILSCSVVKLNHNLSRKFNKWSLMRI